MYLKLDDVSLNDAFRRIEHRFRKDDPDHEIMKEAFYNLRDNFGDLVKSCSKDMNVCVHFEDVLEEPLSATSGRGNNKLEIFIKTDGRILYCWTKETAVKLMKDAMPDVKGFAKKILRRVAEKLSRNRLRELRFDGKKAITYNNAK